MPILLDGNHICEKCGKDFPWIYFELIRTKFSSGMFRVEKIPDEPKAYSVETLNDNEHKIFINCPHCGHDNIFICKQALKEKLGGR